MATTSNNNGKIDGKTEQFHKFLKKFDPKQLPYIFRITSNDTIRTTYYLKRLDSKSDDTLFVTIDGMDEVYCYGYLTDTSKYYALIFLFPGDNYYPVLITYTKSGKLISQENLLANGLSEDSGLSYYSENGIVNKDLTIFCTDTAIWNFLCNVDGKRIPHSTQSWVFLKQGNVKKDGTIFIDTTITARTVTKL